MSSRKLYTKIAAAVLSLAFLSGLAPIQAPAYAAADYVWGSSTSTPPGEYYDVISGRLSRDLRQTISVEVTPDAFYAFSLPFNKTVIVVGGSPGAPVVGKYQLKEFAIHDSSKIIWEACYENADSGLNYEDGSIILHNPSDIYASRDNDGLFVVAPGASINNKGNYGTAIRARDVNICIAGGRVESIQGTAIVADLNSTVFITGGVVAGAFAPAINTEGPVIISGGVVFGYRATSLNDVIQSPNPPDFTGDGLVIAYEGGYGPEAGTSEGLRTFPSGGSAVWTNSPGPGINYAYGSNRGFLSLNVTVREPVDEPLSIAVTSTGLGSLKVGVPVTGSIVYTLTNGVYATRYTSADFAVSNLPTGLFAGIALRTSDTVVTVPITGTPTTFNANTGAVRLPVTIPASNVTGASSPIPVGGTVAVGAVAKGDGAAVSGPPAVIGTPTANSISTSPVTNATSNRQNVEYAISTNGTATPINGWQSSAIFDGLQPGTTYYVFARTAANTNYNAGASQRSVGITTAAGGKTVTVGAQTGALTAGVGGDAVYTVATTGIANGSTIALNNINNVTGISLVTTTTTNNSTAVTIRTANTTPQGSHPLTLSIDGVTSNQFTLNVSTGAYTITFNPNGGTVNPPWALTGTDGKMAGLPTPARGGYTFNGWYTAANGGVQVTTGTVFTADTTVYARWTQNSDPADTGDSQPPIGVVVPEVTIEPTEADDEQKAAAREAVENAAASNEANGVVVTQAGDPVVIVAPEDPTLVTFEDNSDGATIYAIVNEDGTLTPVPTTFNDDGTVTLLLSGGEELLLVPVSLSAAFTDITDYWGEQDILGAASRGILNGMGGGIYSARSPLTVAQTATAFLRALGVPTDTNIPGAWYAGAMSMANKIGLFGRIDPTATMTRIGTAELIYNAFSYVGTAPNMTLPRAEGVLASFTDLGSLTDAQKIALAVCVGLDIFRGNGDGTMSPDGQLQRVHLASLTVRLQDVILNGR